MHPDDVPATVRPYRGGGSDAAATLRIFESAVGETAGADYDDRQIDAWAAVGRHDVGTWDEARAAAHTSVADVAAEVSGFVDWTDNGILDMLFVDPRRTRRGLARLLIRHVQHEAREAGLTSLRTYASRTARPVFERLGFITVAHRPGNMIRGVPVPNFEMRCELPRAR